MFCGGQIREFGCSYLGGSEGETRDGIESDFT